VPSGLTINLHAFALCAIKGTVLLYFDEQELMESINISELVTESAN